MDAKQSLLEKIKDGSFALCTDEQIARKLKLGKRERFALRDMLQSLCREGVLLCDSKNRFGTAEQFGAIRGTFSGNERGFGFVMPDSPGLDDLFIPRSATKGALHRDTVLAISVKGRSDDEGEILAVEKRGYEEIVGVYRKEKRAGFLHPDERKYSEEIFIPEGKENNCPDGAKAVAKLLFFPSGSCPVGEISEVLGAKGDFLTEELALIRAHGLREEFSESVLSEADRQAARAISPADLSGRVDLRNELIVTIDGEDTRDIDDAISVRRENERFSLGVHIADVSHYVRLGGVLDQEAFRRGTSVYFPDRVLPMLPPALSNGICSLNEGEDRLTLSCFMTIDRTGKVLEKRIAPSVIRSRHRMTYSAVTQICEGIPAARAAYPDLIEMLDAAAELTQILKKARLARGGVALDVREAKILYSEGKISVPDAPRSLSHEMIEQFMVLANESVATIMTQKKAPFVYRVHEAPSREKASDFASFLRDAGIRVPFDPEKVSPADYRDLLTSLQDSPLYSLVNRVMLRSMMKAKYAPENVGHFGLASDCYCHFTSPIRRYPDLCIHRIVKDSLNDPQSVRSKYQKITEEASLQSSLCEKNAADAEREVDALYIVAYMQEHLGEEYEATVSGVTSFGLFAELDNTIEGFLPLETLPDDYYDFIEKKFLLKGTAHTFRLGERIRIKVAAVDWGARRTHFLFLEKI